MAAKRVKKLLEKQTFPFEIRDFEVNFESTEHARALLDIPMERIAKTLVYKSQFGAIVIILSGDRLVDAAKYKKKFGVSQYVLEEDELLQATGYEPGSVSPVALPDKRISVYMDKSLARFESDYVYPSGGTPNSAIGIRPNDLYQLAGCKPG